jgi:hypothetical protein
MNLNLRNVKAHTFLFHILLSVAFYGLAAAALFYMILTCIDYAKESVQFAEHLTITVKLGTSIIVANFLQSLNLMAAQ